MFDPAKADQPDRREQPRPLLRNVLGEVLRRTRREQRRTLADVASAARVSMPYLSEVERGRKEASSEVLAAICAALGIDLAELVAEVGSDLLVERARRSPVVRLDVLRDSMLRDNMLRDGAIRDSASRSSEPRALAGNTGTSNTGTCLLAA
jgi:transcriptional regulator with XRE-family HTH domain